MMTRIRSDKKYTVKKDKIIYALLSPTDQRSATGRLPKKELYGGKIWQRYCS